MRSNSIRKNIINNIIWVLVITGVITISVVILVAYSEMDKQKTHDLSELALERSSKISSYLKNSSDLAEYLSTFPEVVKWTENPDQKNTEEALNFFNDFNIKKQYSSIYILDKSGVALISTDPTFVNNNYSFRPYFQKAINGEKNMYTAIGATSKAQGYYFAQPIKKEGGEIIGVLALKLAPNSMYTLFNAEFTDLESHIMLVDNYGIVLYSDIKGRELKSLGNLKPEVLEKIKNEKKFLNIDISPLQYQEAENIVSKATKDITIYTFFDKDDGEKELIAVSPIKNYSLFLVTEDGSWQSSLGATFLIIILGLLILLSNLIILLFISRLIAKKLTPLKSLGDMVKNIGADNLEIENKITSGDELEELGSFFAIMSKKLHEYYNDLENKVAQRTKELGVQNEYLNKTKVATMNILEDVENERSKTAELAKNLEKFKLALDNASDHIVITDIDGRVLYGNSGVEKITGYSLKEAIGKKAGELWRQPMEQEYYEKLWKTIKEDKKTFDGEIKNKRKNGELYDAKITISPVLNNKKEIEFFIGIERDITHEKMVDQTKTEFVSLASHQLRTPLSSINWYSEMLLDGDAGKLTEKQKTFIKEIYDGNHRMVDLVNSLLNVSRLELGTFAVDPEPTDVIKTAQSVLLELQPGIIKNKIKINFKYDKKIPIIQADPKLVRIIFQNLLSNSIKYTPEKGTVSLSIERDEKNLLVEVADTGYGIPKNEQPRIFEKLFRAENIREKDTEGTGLGLYIVKSIITHSGGHISFKSEENKGTTFYLEIPLTGMKKKDGDKKIE
jgi:PAS domain S-box-containing protein